VPTSHTADARVSTGQIPCMDIGPLAYTTPPPPKVILFSQLVAFETAFDR